MPPIMSRQQKDPKKTDEKGLICRVKYNNTLPDFPFDPKFITYPFDPNRFVQYKPTSLEKHHKHDLLTEHDLGVNVDLVDLDIYMIPPEYHAHGGVMPLPLEDEKLLEEEVTPQNDAKRSRQHNKVIPWLKKTEYISTEFNRYGACSEKTETKVGYNVKKKMKEDPLYLDKEGQIAAIDKTFEDAKKPITEHHSKKGVVPVAIYDVFPDFERWKYPFAQVQFDADPAPMSQSEEMRQAMVRGVMDESGEQFVAYFLPTKETLEKRKRDKELGVEYVEGEEYEYDMAREYNWNVKSKTSKGYEENYFFIFDDNDKRVYYNELDTRVRLSKRRSKTESHASNSKLIVKHRPPAEQEEHLQRLRMRAIEKPLDDEEEEERNNDEDDQESNRNDEEEERGGQEEEDDEESKGKKRSRETSPSSESASGSSSSGSDEEMEEPSVKRKPQEEIFGESESDSD